VSRNIFLRNKALFIFMLIQHKLKYLILLGDY
jgi:hypothetical protein